MQAIRKVVVASGPRGFGEEEEKKAPTGAFLQGDFKSITFWILRRPLFSTRKFPPIDA